MLVDKKIILQKDGINFMILEKHKINTKDYEFDSAMKELKKYAQNSDVGTWGYFPELNDEEAKYPSCIKLRDQLNSLIKDDKINWNLSFIRLAIKEPKSEYGGFHIDVDAGAAHIKNPAFKDKEVIRLLMNCGSNPRKLGFIDKSRDELVMEGHDIPHDKYKILKFPEEMIKTIDIPAIEKDSIYILKFWASIIPHFGLTDEKGHFLTAYGAWADFTSL